MLSLKTKLLLVVALVLIAPLVLAQIETGQITGVISDQSGAVIAEATVTATATGTQVARTTKSTSSGTFVIPSLAPGTYIVTVTQANFQTYKQEVNVAVGARMGLDVKLQVGSTSTVVEVAGEAVQINTETQTVGQVVSSQEITQLPTISRNPYDLVKTVGNVSDADPSGRGAGVAVNGLRSSGTNVLLDGVANNNEFTASVGIQVPQESVEELNVLTNNFTAEYGRAGAGVINVATKQGSNDWHGSAYEFNRVSDLASNLYDNNARGITKPVFTRNEFGYALGGAIKKNKLFFYENTEWLYVRSTGEQSAVVPTTQFINAMAPASQQFFSTFGKLKQNITLGPTFTAADAGCKTAACAALGNTPLYQLVTYGVPADSGGGAPSNNNSEVGRIDYNLNDKTQVYFRMARQYASSFAGTETNSPWQGYDTGDLTVNDGFALSATHTFSPQAVSQTKLSYNRMSDLQPLASQPIAPTLYTTLTTTSQLGGASIAYPGYSPYSPGNAVPFGGPQNFMAVDEDFTFTRGAHSFRFGGMFTRLEDDRTFGAYEEAVEALGTNLASSVNNLLIGQAHDFQAAIYPQGEYPCVNGVVTAACTLTLPVGPPNFSRSNVYHEAALYAQDAWKFNRRLTINLGLRWEYFGPQQNKDPKLDSNFYLGAGSNIELQSATGTVQIGENSPVGGLWKKDWHDFGPRVGFAYDLTGDGKTSIRGGWGIAYERNFGNVTFNMIQNPPNYGVIALTAGADVPTIPITTNNAGPLAGSSGTKPLGRVTLRGVDPNIKTAYAHLYSLSVERQLAPDAIVGVDYSGSQGINLYTIDRLNIPGSDLVYAGQGGPTTRINPQYSYINFRTNGGNSIYNGVNFRSELRNYRNSGLSLRANYTWSHSIDTGSTTFSESANNANLGSLDPLNPNLDRGDSDFDVRQRFVVAGVWEEPFFKSRNLASQIAGGWEISPIFTARTGTPFTVYDCTNAAYVFCPRVMYDTPFATNYTDTPTGNPNEFAYINMGKPDSSYVNALTGVADFGPFPSTMTGRNDFRTPGTYSFTLAAYKNFRITERVKLQFRAEAFNVLNHSNLYIVYNNNDVSSSPTMNGAPIITATRGIRADSTAVGTSVNNGRLENRNIQLALRLSF